jgi:hypothetical protein
MVFLCSIKTGKMSSTSYHKDDIGFDDYWRFFATSHGKGACDRIGGTIKRLPRKEICQTLTRSTSQHQDDFTSGLL